MQLVPPLLVPPLGPCDDLFLFQTLKWVFVSISCKIATAFEFERVYIASKYLIKHIKN
ncbi:hypothetical protein RchiOBHm_Chr5g0052251 [Rosa chinensis]|uniref:Uncharacterized protein n=1 Tax=Rosa chinensis TaxID=74649 RepID=A0A2P6QFK0_ROSCH|nr:hypothetical protein RchiOBHm_Chr5g0052251 [Rosa chinensis]